MTINVTIKNKIAVAEADARIVCGNSDYEIVFDFDEEWASKEKKTARFKWNKNGKSKHKDVDFTGDTVPVPILTGIFNVYVGVYAGDLCTTTPAKIRCKHSILCGDSAVEDVSPDVWVQLQEENEQQAEQIEQQAKQIKQLQTENEQQTQQINLQSGEISWLRTLTGTTPKQLNKTESLAELANRIKRGDFTGINIGDWIEVTYRNPGTPYNNGSRAYVMGIDTYYGIGNPGSKVGHHVDFAMIDGHITGAMNSTDTNNGTAAEANPWRASKAFQDMNSGAIFIDFSLEPYIIEKIAQVNSRYSSSGLVNSQTGWKQNTFSSLGKFWLPTEAEVFGNPIRGEGAKAIQGGGWNVQYPLFRDSLKLFCEASSDDTATWLCTPMAANSTSWCAIKTNGNLTTYTARTKNILPVCFRIGQEGGY